jgi:hypothetical protein
MLTLETQETKLKIFKHKREINNAVIFQNLNFVQSNMSVAHTSNYLFKVSQQYAKPICVTVFMHSTLPCNYLAVLYYHVPFVQLSTEQSIPCYGYETPNRNCAPVLGCLTKLLMLSMHQMQHTDLMHTSS